MIKIKAKIKLLQGENKRKTAFSSGYRPLFNFIPSMKKSGQIRLIGREQLYPGEEAIAEIIFADENFLGDFNIDTNFTFGEAIEILGEGTVIEIYP